MKTRAGTAVPVALVCGMILAACAVSSSSTVASVGKGPMSHTRAPAESVMHSGQAARNPRSTGGNKQEHKPVHRRKHSKHGSSDGRGGCPSDALRGVYHSYRLHVLRECTWVKGIVTDVRHEDDGDYHVNVRPSGNDKRLLDSKNRSIQHGALVCEIMLGQHFSPPSIGDRVAIFGTWVLDSEHGWNEIHPIWAIRYGGGQTQYALPPAKPRYDPDGGGSGSGNESGSGSGRNNNNGGGGNGNCDPSYPSVCIPPPPPDLDCSDIKYRNFKVKGADPHNFDSDGDHIGCET